MSSSYSLLSTFKRRTLSDRPVNSVILPPRTTLITELPPCAKEPFSTIISEEHAAEISAWIDRKTSNYATTNIPYDFQLILLGTRDGFAPQTFWNICNVSLLERDDLQIEEIKVWDYVIKWGIAQNPDLPTDVEE
ncbi:hypothetical protein Glove_151g5 [Diversispora epigaea]|uniref:TLDc domain-containing protein n=1 Tax=Diversispora epigaea TaxID=1348612 RepID=A0A397ISY2_9GLOM|nr:hypothetical protein Glove_151g5 [Diversispora epigaea]